MKIIFRGYETFSTEKQAREKCLEELNHIRDYNIRELRENRLVCSGKVFSIKEKIEIKNNVEKHIFYFRISYEKNRFATDIIQRSYSIKIVV